RLLPPPTHSLLSQSPATATSSTLSLHDALPISLILNREAGSFFFLGELLVDIPLPVDQPVEEGCGKCVACMTICPTGAIVEPYTDRKSTRLNSSHASISYAVFCLTKKKRSQRR